MADYGQTQVAVRYGEQSDYSDKLLNRVLVYNSTTAVEVQSHIFTASETAYTIDLGGFTTIQTIVVHNRGSTNAVEAQWSSAAPVSGATANKQLIGAGGILVLPSATVGNDLILDCAAGLTTEVEVLIYGI